MFSDSFETVIIEPHCKDYEVEILKFQNFAGGVPSKALIGGKNSAQPEMESGE
jgi:hypothetical protein